MASSSPRPPTTASSFGLKRPSSLDLGVKRGRRKSSWQSSSHSSDDSDVSFEHSQDSNFASEWRMEEGGEDLVNSVYSFLKVYLSSSETNSGDSLDVRIAQAMDLVTTALKSSIRTEFDKYQDKIEHLEEFAAKLKSENETLRQHVDQDVLDQFKQLQQQQQQQQQQQENNNHDELQQLLLHQQKLQVQLKQQQHLRQQLQLQQQVHMKSQMGNHLLDSQEQLHAKQLQQLSADDFGCEETTSDGILEQAAKLNGPHFQN